MLSSMDFIRQSLEVHLFFARIMKEHSFFLQIGFTPKDKNFTRTADEFRNQFDMLLAEVVTLSNGIVSEEVLQSGEVVTPYTMDAEIATAHFTGIRIPVEITQAELGLTGEGGVSSDVNQMLEQKVYFLNQRAMDLIEGLIQFKQTVLTNVTTCRMYTVNYPLLIDHIMREAKLYLKMIEELQSRETKNMEQEALENEIFWNNIMAEHSKFIRGLLDPTENTLISTANDFGNEFDQLTEQAKAVNNKAQLEKVTEDSLEATKAIRDFKAQGTEGILDCKVQSIIIPLLGDHTLREASHFLRLLEKYENLS